jgi:hypothetical protein
LLMIMPVITANQQSVTGQIGNSMAKSSPCCHDALPIVQVSSARANRLPPAAGLIFRSCADQSAADSRTCHASLRETACKNGTSGPQWPRPPARLPRRGLRIIGNPPGCYFSDKPSTTAYDRNGTLEKPPTNRRKERRETPRPIAIRPVCTSHHLHIAELREIDDDPVPDVERVIGYQLSAVSLSTRCRSP